MGFYVLVILFGTTEVVPVAYDTKEDCMKAGRMAYENAITGGGVRLSFTCVPVPAKR